MMMDVGSQNNLNHFHVLPEDSCLVMFTVVSQLTMWWWGGGGGEWLAMLCLQQLWEGDVCLG